MKSSRCLRIYILQNISYQKNIAPLSLSLSQSPHPSFSVKAIPLINLLPAQRGGEGEVGCWVRSSGLLGVFSGRRNENSLILTTICRFADLFGISIFVKWVFLTTKMSLVGQFWRFMWFWIQWSLYQFWIRKRICAHHRFCFSWGQGLQVLF